MTNATLPVSNSSALVPSAGAAPTTTTGTSGGATLFRALQGARAGLMAAARRGFDSGPSQGAYDRARAAFLDHPADAREQVSFRQSATTKRPAQTITMPVRDAQSRLRDNNPITVSGMFAAKVS